ncbi:MAG: NADH-quinone oxidoreductase subunit NuoH [Chloroflexi bacterium]|nr:NADH-quinone oxidoreductase subunit NuoH [Chloroflexota bacterium]
MSELLISILIMFAKSAILLLMLLTATAYVVLLERKAVGRIQVRYGPNRTGPFGLLQPIADALKLLLKEPLMPRDADRLTFTLAPLISLVAALVAFAVIPIGPPIELFGRQIALQVADVNIGILYILAISSLGVYGIVLAGWSSRSKYALLGGVRSSAQMISYELPLGLSILGVVMIAGSLSLGDIVRAQAALPFAVLQPLGFALYFICALAETNRAPFDLPEAEQELVAGYHTEYSGMRFAMFFIAEYVNMITVSAIATTLFLGGYHGPIVAGPHWFAVKVLALLLVFVWVRATLPRLRYDRLMRFGWQVLLPLALLNVVATAVGIAILS